MQTKQTHIFFRKARRWIKRIALITLSLITILIAITSFLLSTWGEPWLIFAFEKAIAQQKSVDIDFKKMYTLAGSIIVIEGLKVTDLKGNPLVFLNQVNLHFSILQLLHGSLPLEQIEIPSGTCYPKAFTHSSDSTHASPSFNFSPFKIDIPFWMLLAHTRLDISRLAIEGHDQSCFSINSLIRLNPFRRYLELHIIERTDKGNQPQLQLRLSQFLGHGAVELEGFELHQSTWLKPRLGQIWSSTTFFLELEGSLEDWSQKNDESEFPCRLQGKLESTVEGNERLFQLSSKEKALIADPMLHLKSRFTVENYWKIFTKKFEIKGWGLETIGNLFLDMPESSFKLTMEGPFKPAPSFTPGMDWHTSDFRIDIGGDLRSWKGAFELQAPKLDLTPWNETLSQAKAETAISYELEKGLEINGNIQAIYEERPIHIDLIAKKSEERWQVQELQVGSQGMDLSIESAQGLEEEGWYLKAKLGLEPSLISQVLLRRFNLQAGALELFAHWELDAKAPSLANVDFNLKLQELTWNSWRVQSTEATGRLALSTKQMHDFNLESITLNALHIEQEDQLICNRFQSYGWGNNDAVFFQLQATRQSQFSGSDIDYDLSSEGLFTMNNGNLKLSLEGLKGSWSDLMLKMPQTTFIEIQDNQLVCNDLELELGDGRLQLSGQFSSEQAFLAARCHKLPVNMVSLLIGRPLWGQASGLITIEANDKDCKGELFLELQSLRTENQVNPSVDINGQFKGNWIGDNLSFDASLYTPHERLHGSVKGLWQVLAEPKNWNKAALDKNHDLSIDLEGKLGLFSALFIDESFDFDGQVDLHFHTQGTPNHPQIEGQAQVLSGSFEHYGIGLKIQDISCHLHGEQDTIWLDELRANDGANGQLKADGHLRLSGDIRSESTLILDHFCFLETPLVYAKATGHGYFNHYGLSAKLGGNFTLEKASIKIPDLLPNSVPEFHDYTIIRKPGKRTLSAAWLSQTDKANADKPGGFIEGVVSFDLNLKVPSGFVLEGRGLHSSWEGEVKVLGHQEQMKLSGHMSLEEGDFRFGSRRFIVKEGEVEFAGQPLQDTQLRIASEATVDQVTIRAMLTGPLTQPRLQFNATPNLSLADLFSHILFGKAYNSLSPFQALQVAQLALETSGTANTDAFTQLRKKTGMDRIDIAQKPGSAATTDEGVYTVKLGKYLADGFLVGINKNVSTEGTQLTLELDLTEHLSLITEIGYNDDSSLNLMWKKEY